MTKLPAADWTQRKDLAALVTTLGPENLRWVGGAVRDTLLGDPVRDVDAATTLHPDAVMVALRNAGITPIPTGIEHGTITAVLPQGNVEITTLRKDVATDGRRATVAFAQEWRDDAARRDFTINALYADPETLEISDYFDGVADLEARRVRFIGDARQRIREDHLRILRYYRFQARFGSMLDGEAEQACADLAPTLKGLSRERVAMELLNLLGLPAPVATTARMFERGVLQIVLPEVLEDRLHKLDKLNAWEINRVVAPDALRRLAALLPSDPLIAKQVANRLRFSAAQRKRLMRMADPVRDEEDPRVIAYREGFELARDRLLIAGRSSLAIEGWPIPTFPLKGGAIVAQGIKAGSEISRILRAVETRWIAEGFPDATRVEQLLAEELANQSS